MVIAKDGGELWLAPVLAFFDMDDSFSSLTQLRSSALTTTCDKLISACSLKQCKEGIRVHTPL